MMTSRGLWSLPENLKPTVLALRALNYSRFTNNVNATKGLKIEKQKEEDSRKEKTRKTEYEAMIQAHVAKKKKMMKRTDTDEEEAADNAQEHEIRKRKRQQKEETLLNLLEKKDITKTKEEDEILALLIEKNKAKRKREQEETIALLLQKKKWKKEREQAALSIYEDENKKKRKKKNKEDLEQKMMNKKRKEHKEATLFDKERKIKKRKEEGELIVAAHELEKKKKRKVEQEEASSGKRFKTNGSTSESLTDKERSKPSAQSVRVVKKLFPCSSTREETLQRHRKRKGAAMMVQCQKLGTKKRIGSLGNHNNEGRRVKRYVLYDIPGPIPDIDELLLEFNSNQKLFRNFFRGVPESY